MEYEESDNDPPFNVTQLLHQAASSYETDDSKVSLLALVILKMICQEVYLVTITAAAKTKTSFIKQK